MLAYGNCRMLILSITLVLILMLATPVFAQGTVVHIVQQGENLFRIALRHGVTVDALVAANSLSNPRLIYVGQRLVIPSAGSSTRPATSSVSGVHIVQRGENLFRIALRYGVTVDALAAANGIVSGYPDGYYHPEYEVDRGQMAVFIARSTVQPTGEVGLATYEPPATPTFPDVTTDPANPYSACYSHIEYIAEQGVVHGYPDNLYHPEYIVTRGLMALFVARAFDLLPPSP